MDIIALTVSPEMAGAKMQNTVSGLCWMFYKRGFTEVPAGAQGARVGLRLTDSGPVAPGEASVVMVCGCT